MPTGWRPRARGRNCGDELVAGGLHPVGGLRDVARIRLERVGAIVELARRDAEGRAGLVERRRPPRVVGCRGRDRIDRRPGLIQSVELLGRALERIRDRDVDGRCEVDRGVARGELDRFVRVAPGGGRLLRRVLVRGPRLVVARRGIRIPCLGVRRPPPESRQHGGPRRDERQARGEPAPRAAATPARGGRTALTGGNVVVRVHAAIQRGGPPRHNAPRHGRGCRVGCWTPGRC